MFESFLIVVGALTTALTTVFVIFGLMDRLLKAFGAPEGRPSPTFRGLCRAIGEIGRDDQ